MNGFMEVVFLGSSLVCRDMMEIGFECACADEREDVLTGESLDFCCKCIRILQNFCVIFKFIIENPIKMLVTYDGSNFRGIVHNTVAGYR